ERKSPKFNSDRLLRKHSEFTMRYAMCSSVRRFPAFQVDIAALWHADTRDHFRTGSDSPALGDRHRPGALDRTVGRLLDHVVRTIGHDRAPVATGDITQPDSRRPGDLGRDLPRARHRVRPRAGRARALPAVGTVAPRLRPHRPQFL